MPSQPTIQSVSQSLIGAAKDGTITQQTSNLLTGNLGALVVAGAAGQAAETIKASEVTLFTLCIDKSSSINAKGLEDAVREGQNHVIEALADAKEADGILVAQWLFNHTQEVLHSYVPVRDAVRLDASNYHGYGNTCLYDTVADALAANLAYAHDLENGAFPTPCRSVVVVVTDGEDVGSQRYRDPQSVAPIVRDLVKSEKFIVGFVGVGPETDFRPIAKKMGFPDGSILVERDATPSAMRKVFQMVSRSAKLASQGKVKPGVSGNFFNP